MQNIWNNIIESTSIVNSATVLSVVLAILFFIYQEYRQHNQQEKEANRLKDELVNLIIRNHVNSGVHISRIDLSSFFDGFELLKDCKMGYDTKELIKIVYAKVYENEHISNEIRLDLLKELENLLNEFELDFIENVNVSNNKRASQLSANISSAIVVALYPVIIYFLGNTKLALWIAQGWRQVLIVLPIFLLIIGRQYLDKLICFISSKILLFLDIVSRKDKIYIGEGKPNTNEEETINKFHLNINNLEIAEVAFDELFEDKKYILTTFEQRLILEKLVRRLYFLTFREETNLPVSRILSMLGNDKVLIDNLVYMIRRAYSFSSYVIHEGRLPQEIRSYEELIDLMKSLSGKVNEIIKDYEKDHIVLNQQ